jgi:hypothetical protein
MLTREKPQPGESLLLPSSAHRGLGPSHDAAVLRLFASEPGARPEGAFEARRELLALAWPDAADPSPLSIRRASTKPAKPANFRPLAHRVEEDGADPARQGHEVPMDEARRGIDHWLERPIVQVALTPQSLARASSFARAAHPTLQAVLRVDRERGEIWLEAPRGERPVRPLRKFELESARAALEALHRTGAVHGIVDPDHVLVGEDGVMVLFSPAADPGATMDNDRIALGRLGAER